MAEEFDREWSQDELREYLLKQGMKPEDFIPGEIIPQFVKYVSAAPLTEADVIRALRLIEEHPEWNRAGVVTERSPSGKLGSANEKGDS